MSYVFISGRTIDQATGMHIGKLSDFYRRAVSMVEMNKEDLEEAGFSDGEEVVLVSQWGKACCWIKTSDIPRGMVFVPMGPVANAVAGPDTDGTGMPLFKGFEVDIRKREENGS